MADLTHALQQDALRVSGKSGVTRAWWRTVAKRIGEDGRQRKTSQGGGLKPGGVKDVRRGMGRGLGKGACRRGSFWGSGDDTLHSFRVLVASEGPALPRTAQSFYPEKRAKSQSCVMNEEKPEDISKIQKKGGIGTGDFNEDGGI